MLLPYKIYMNDTIVVRVHHSIPQLQKTRPMSFQGTVRVSAQSSLYHFLNKLAGISYRSDYLLFSSQHLHTQRPSPMMYQSFTGAEAIVVLLSPPLPSPNVA